MQAVKISSALERVFKELLFLSPKTTIIMNIVAIKMEIKNIPNMKQ